MKNIRNSAVIGYFRWASMSLLCITFLGCSSVPIEQTKIAEPGTYLLKQMAVNEITDTPSVLTYLEKESENPLLSEQVKTHLQVYPRLSAEILIARQSGLTEEGAATEVLAANPNSAVDIILITLGLFPDQGERIAEQLLLNDSFTESDIQEGWLLAKRDPLIGFPPTASNSTGVKIQPLFNSASITLFERSQTDRASIRFKQRESEEWQAGMGLQWDPVRGALSGSIVKLQADTDYQIEVILTTPDAIQETQYSFKTRSESPPINPDLVYYLSDIYNGGQLDLEVLNIQGEADGWAKIIGDENTPIVASESDWSAINVGNNSYVMFENIIVKGGVGHGIKADKAHHIWINGCNVSNFGQAPSHFKDGIGYANASDSNPINYQAGIAFFYVGSVVIENCEIHSPNGYANHWGHGHPKGPSAVLILAKHSNSDFEGQYVIRHNRFYGSENKRFNDIIESRSNGRVFGGFLRDSAVHDNYFAYANDDIIELDGGQSNVLVYNNEIEQGYVGISAIPNMLGPNYIFNNYIHNLGDQRGGAWAAIKLGGLITAPAGKSLIFENLVENKVANGIAASRFKGDYTYWAYARNNIFLALGSAGSFGYGILDRNKYSESVYTNNFIYNRKLQEAKIDANITQAFSSTDLNYVDFAEQVISSPESFHLLPESGSPIPNFSTLSEDGYVVVGMIKKQTEDSEQPASSENPNSEFSTEIGIESQITNKSNNN